MTATTIRIPTPLRALTDGVADVVVEGSDVATALGALGERYAGILERVLDEEGALRPFVNVFVGSTNLRELDGLQTELREGDVLSIVPAVAGGGLS